MLSETNSQNVIKILHTPTDVNAVKDQVLPRYINFTQVIAYMDKWTEGQTFGNFTILPPQIKRVQ